MSGPVRRLHPDLPGSADRSLHRADGSIADHATRRDGLADGRADHVCEDRDRRSRDLPVPWMIPMMLPLTRAPISRSSMPCTSFPSVFRSLPYWLVAGVADRIGTGPPPPAWGRKQRAVGEASPIRDGVRPPDHVLPRPGSAGVQARAKHRCIDGRNALDVVAGGGR